MFNILPSLSLSLFYQSKQSNSRHIFISSSALSPTKAQRNVSERRAKETWATNWNLNLATEQKRTECIPRIPSRRGMGNREIKRTLTLQFFVMHMNAETSFPQTIMQITTRWRNEEIHYIDPPSYTSNFRIQKKRKKPYNITNLRTFPSNRISIIPE